MNFKELLLDARLHTASQEKILEMYAPLLYRAAMIDGQYDEDLYQELCLILIRCTQTFEI